MLASILRLARSGIRSLLVLITFLVAVIATPRLKAHLLPLTPPAVMAVTAATTAVTLERLGRKYLLNKVWLASFPLLTPALITEA